jgi:hypothetical protein
MFSVLVRRHRPFRWRWIISVLILVTTFPAKVALAGQDVWTPIGPSGQDVRSIFVYSNAPLFSSFAGTFGGGVFILSGESTWIQSNSGLTNLSVVSIVGANLSLPCGICPPTLWAATDGGGIFESSSASLWTAVNNGLSNLSVTAMALGPGSLYAATPTGLFKSALNPTSWNPVGAGLPTPVTAVAPDPTNPSIVFAGTGAGVFRSRDGGATWTGVNTGLPSNGTVEAMALDPVSPSIIYVSIWSTIECPPPCSAPPSPLRQVFKSVDSGDHWAESDVGLLIGVTSLAVDPTTDSTLYAAGYDPEGSGGVFRSTNGGANWVGVDAGLSNLDVRTLAFDPTTAYTLYAGTAGSGAFQNLFSQSGGLCASGQTLCLDEGLFQVQVSWQSSTSSGVGQAIGVTRSTGAFWFFDPTNLELVVKVLDGRSINGKWWVFYGSLTNVESTPTVTDTLTGAVKTYLNPQGTLASVADTSAF